MTNMENDSYQKKMDEMQEKLRIGRERISSGYSDNDKMGCALLSFHGALEDYFRAYLSVQYSEEREKIQDVIETRWNGLLDYARNPLGLSANDENMILDANRVRQNFAHGLTFNWDANQLSNYINLVEQFCSTNYQSESEEYRPQPETREDYQPQKSKGGNVLVMLIILIIIIVLINSCSNIFKNIQLVNEGSQTETVPAIGIVWKDFRDSDLGYKNRYDVWEEIVEQQVQGCAMTFTEFKEEVLKYNPRLKDDGYEFKKNVIYKLPECSNNSPDK